MANRELWYAQQGPLEYDDAWVPVSPEAPWYPAPYENYPLRAALISQAYVTDVPVNDIEIARRMDVDGTPGVILKAGTNSLPADSVIAEDATNIIVTGRNIVPDTTLNKTLGTALLAWLEAHVGEVNLIPKVSSSGPEGTIFYDSDDDHVYVATEA